jgi:hypothetical protein
VEVKSKLLERHVDEHIKRLEVLRAWADKHGDTVKIDIPEGFVPRQW